MMQLAGIGERSGVAIVEMLIGGSERATTSCRLHVTPISPNTGQETNEKCWKGGEQAEVEQLEHLARWVDVVEKLFQLAKRSSDASFFCC